MKRDGGDGVSRFLMDNRNPTRYSQALAEVSEDGLETVANYHYADGFGPAAQSVYDPASKEFDAEFLLRDHLSTTRSLTDSAGNADLMAYSPFGSQTEGAGSLTDYQYTGQYRDSATGLQHHRARWLDTDAGRWLTTDPVFDFPNNFGNAYGYVGGALINLADPSGQNPVAIVVVVVLALTMLTIGFVALRAGVTAYRQGGAGAGFGAFVGSVFQQIAILLIFLTILVLVFALWIVNPILGTIAAVILFIVMGYLVYKDFTTQAQQVGTSWENGDMTLFVIDLIILILTALTLAFGAVTPSSTPKKVNSKPSSPIVEYQPVESIGIITEPIDLYPRLEGPRRLTGLDNGPKLLKEWHKFTPMEKQRVKELMEMGYDIEVIERINESGRKTADWRVGGVYDQETGRMRPGTGTIVEYKGIQGSGDSTIRKNIHLAAEKEGVELICIDARYTELSVDQIRSQVIQAKQEQIRKHNNDLTGTVQILMPDGTVEYY